MRFGIYSYDTHFTLKMLCFIRIEGKKNFYRFGFSINSCCFAEYNGLVVFPGLVKNLGFFRCLDRSGS
ncbi:hypothetical protein ES708_29800 [subsurface metagenome]